MRALRSAERPPTVAGFAPRLRLLRRRLRFVDFNLLSLVVTLVGMSLYFSSASPYFLGVNNFLNIGRAVSINGIVAVGLTIVMLAGGLDLTVASVMAATGMIVASLLLRGAPEWLAVLVGCSAGMAMGAANGLLVTRARINPVVATLGTMSIIRGLGFIVSKGQNISIGIQHFSFLGRGYVAGIPTSLLLWLAACALGFFILRYTLFGQYIYAIGGNADACRVSGVRVDWWRFLTYIVCSLAASFAGVMLLSLSAIGSPVAGIGAELDIIAAVILGGVGLSGGRGGIIGTVLGTLILGVLNNGMILTGIAPYYQYVVRGTIMVAAVTLDSLRSGGGYR